MSARRSCGRYRLSVELALADVYVVRITLEGGLVSVQQINPPAAPVRALDDPTAFDEAAHAAMSFFPAEPDFDDRHAEASDTGWVIRRVR